MAPAHHLHCHPLPIPAAQANSHDFGDPISDLMTRVTEATLERPEHE